MNSWNTRQPQKRILLCFLHICLCLTSAHVITTGKMSKPRLQCWLWDVILHSIFCDLFALSLPSGLLWMVSMVPFLSDFHTTIPGFQYQTRTALECQPSDGTNGPEGPDRPCADCQSFYHQSCPKFSTFSCCSSYFEIAFCATFQ